MIAYNDVKLKAIDKYLQTLIIASSYIVVYKVIDGKADYIAWKIKGFTPQKTKTTYSKADEVMEWLENLDKLY